MALHKDLTGADLHEPKGVAAASSGQVYVANGSGSGVWIKGAAGNTTIVDTSNRFTGTDVEAALNELYEGAELVLGLFTDVSNPSTVLVPIPYSTQIVSIDFILGGAITVANSTLTITRSDGASMGTQTIVQSGSAEGTTFTFVPAGNATFTYPTHKYIKMVSDGASTTTQPLYFTVTLKRL